MRIPVALAVGILVTTVSAQNWALINPAYKYNYSNDGTDTISNQIFVTHIDTLGVDSFRYDVNLIAEACAPCTGVPLGCWNNTGLRSGVPQFTGAALLRYGTNWSMLGNDTLEVRTSALLGESWTSTSGVIASVSFTTEEVVLGTVDSLKWITFSNGIAMAFGRSHGIVWYSENGEQWSLIGVQGGMAAGSRFPEIKDFFDYQPGDILQYQGTSDGTDGVCIYHTTSLVKYEVLSRTDLPDRTDYLMRRLQNHTTWASPIIGIGCSGSIWISDLVVSLGVEHANYTDDNFLGSGWLDNLWPMALAEPADPNQNASIFASEYHASQWRATKDPQGRYVLEPAQIDPVNPWNWPAVAQCSSDSNYWPVASEEIIGRYVEGVGRTYGRYFIFERNGEETLIGYRIAGVEVGTILTDDVILGQREVASSSAVLTPNPASDHLLLSAAIPGSACSILDLNGQIVVTHKIAAQNERIDVQSLPPGLYVLLMEGARPQRFVIAR